MESILKALYIGITSAIVLITVNININLYKLKFRDFILMAATIFGGCLLLNFVDSKIASFFVYIIPIAFIYKRSQSIIKSVLLDALDIIIIVVVDSIISGIVINVLNIDIAPYSLQYIMLSILIIIGVYFTSKGIGLILGKHRKYIIEGYKSKYALLIYLVLIVTAMMFYFNINWNSSDDPIYLTKVNSIIFVVYSMVLVIICSILIMFIRKEANYKAKQVQLENLEEYTGKLEELYMDMRKFRHDYINIISSMAGFIGEKDSDGLEEYFNTNIYPLNNQMNKNNYKLGLLKNIKIQAIKGLVSVKVIRAQELGLDTIVEVVEPIDNIEMETIDLSRCLGIILDNAIEAALESSEKVVNIAFIKKNSSVIIVVANCFNGQMQPISQLYKEGFSTKGEDRGLGLSNLREIIGSYTNVYLDTYIKQDKFFQEITITDK